MDRLREPAKVGPLHPHARARQCMRKVNVSPTSLHFFCSMRFGAAEKRAARAVREARQLSVSREGTTRRGDGGRAGR
jgi:hypothetical protein